MLGKSPRAATVRTFKVIKLGDFENLGTRITWNEEYPDSVAIQCHLNSYINVPLRDLENLLAVLRGLRCT
jgi:hypothetical protein